MQILDELPKAKARGNTANKPRKDGRSHKERDLNRPFIAWDGEGINHEGEGKAQSYVLFGASTGHMAQGFRLSTVTCLDLMLDCSAANPNAIHVGFSFKYDTEMILADLSFRHWIILRRRNKVRWNGYLIEYYPGKWLRVSQGIGDYKRSCLINDVWGFFQSSFVKALKEWMPAEELSDVERIEQGKESRQQFKFEDLDSYIIPYWKAELRLLVQLMNILRNLLVQANVCPERWHGPGAIASYIYKGKNTRTNMARIPRFQDSKIRGELPLGVYDASRIAYAGGRFELFRMGHYPNTVWQYDINSAYPAGISTLPDLANGVWTYTNSNSIAFQQDSFALWHIQFNILEGNPAGMKLLIQPPPMPFFRRDGKCRISFPFIVDSWVWTPEAKFAVLFNKSCRIVEAWIFQHDGSKPFAFVEEMYYQRQEWKAAGNPAQKALKLALNSLYGKMAQRVGYDDENDTLPPFYQLEWAGYVTSYTRAKLYDAMLKAGLQNVIACETDAIFVTNPVDLPVSNRLGDWSLETHPTITYLQSGTYFAGDKAKYRGLDPKTLTHEQALEWLANEDWDASIPTSTTRFIGAGRGLGKPIHRAWLTESRDLLPGKSGKRIHNPRACPQCRKGLSPTRTLHSMAISDIRGGKSVPHRLPWESNEFRKILTVEKWDTEHDSD